MANTIVFHHIPKCGGSSLNQILKNWFTPVKDYRKRGGRMPAPVDLTALTPRHCLCGHFDHEGAYIEQRYPGVLQDTGTFCFTFVRDPLDVRISLYKYELKQGVRFTNKLLEDLNSPSRRNWLSRRFPIDEQNYKEILDRYAFIGVMERYQMGVDVLAKMLGKPSAPIPWVNATSKSAVSLSREQVSEFKEANRLDYLIYEYCWRKFRELECSY